MIYFELTKQAIEYFRHWKTIELLINDVAIITEYNYLRVDIDFWTEQELTGWLKVLGKKEIKMVRYE